MYNSLSPLLPVTFAGAFVAASHSWVPVAPQLLATRDHVHRQSAPRQHTASLYGRDDCWDRDGRDDDEDPHKHGRW